MATKYSEQAIPREIREEGLYKLQVLGFRLGKPCREKLKPQYHERLAINNIK